MTMIKSEKREREKVEPTTIYQKEEENKKKFAQQRATGRVRKQNAKQKEKENPQKKKKINILYFL